MYISKKFSADEDTEDSKQGLLGCYLFMCARVKRERDFPNEFVCILYACTTFYLSFSLLTIFNA